MDSFVEIIMMTLLRLPAFLIAISVHECAHGYAAYKMGDPTAKYSGRLSLNPLAHFDLIGGLCLLFFSFGWAKPVPVNPYNFKNRKKGTIIVSLAGPLSNFIVAIISAFLCAFTLKYVGYGCLEPISELKGIEFLFPIFQYCMLLNIGLMIFNLIPIPPLDGSKVLMEFLPYKARETMYQLERYSILILVLLINTGALDGILAFLQEGVFEIIMLVLKPFF